MASCFYPKTDKRDKAWNHSQDGKGQKLASILNVRTDRKGRSTRTEKIHHLNAESGRNQLGLPRSKSTGAERLPLKSSTSLVDHIQSVSRRFPSWTNKHNHSRGGSEITEEVIVAYDRALSIDGNRRKKFQGGSFRQLITRQSSEEVSTATTDAAAPDDKPQPAFRSGSSRKSSYRFNEVDGKTLALLLATVDVDNMPDIQEIERLQERPLPNVAVLTKGAGLNSKNPSHILGQPQTGPGLLENPPSNTESGFSIQTNSVFQPDGSTGLLNHSSAPIIKEEKADDFRTTPSEPKPEWERVLESTLAEMNVQSSSLPSLAIEEKADRRDHETVENVALNSQPVADHWQKNRTSTTEIEEEDEDEEKADKRDLQWASLSRRVALWLGTSRPPLQSKSPTTKKGGKADKQAEKREEIAQLTSDSPPLAILQRKPTPVETSKIPETEKEEEQIHGNEEHEILVQSVPNSQQTLASQQKLAGVNHSGVPSTESTGQFNDDHGFGNVQSMPNSQPGILPEIVGRLSSVDDNEAVARIWEQLDIYDGEEIPPVAQEQPSDDERKPMTAGKKLKVAAAASTTRVRRRRVRFSTCGGSDGISVVDISATLLGKLSATKNLQVRYLQDELEQTRAQVDQLEQDFQVQRDLKLAFKMQATRLGDALKKLREFSQENGLDPRQVAGNLVTPNAQPEVSGDSESDDKSREIDSSPELNVLRTQAKQFGWLCEPKEVEMREQIGRGSTADIFKGVWHNLDVAVKCLRPDVYGGNMDVIGGFCQEVELLSRQRHPYILRMFAACLSPPDHAWIVTEYLPSGTLTEWLHGTKTRHRTRIAPLPPLWERLRIATEISIAMQLIYGMVDLVSKQHLHELSPKVLHRDLKPSNILLTEDNHVRIADFNCARLFTAEDAALTGERGTYIYMSPEVITHESYDEKCDIYSFAVILCELVTGTPPYIDTNFSPAEIACKVVQGALRPTLPENQPEMLVELIRDAWEQDPRKRPSFSGITSTLNVIARDVLDVVNPTVE